jgi:hypothetical protein
MVSRSGAAAATASSMLAARLGGTDQVRGVVTSEQREERGLESWESGTRTASPWKAL